MYICIHTCVYRCICNVYPCMYTCVYTHLCEHVLYVHRIHDHKHIMNSYVYILHVYYISNTREKVYSIHCTVHSTLKEWGRYKNMQTPAMIDRRCFISRHLYFWAGQAFTCDYNAFACDCLSNGQNVVPDLTPKKRKTGHAGC